MTIETWLLALALLLLLAVLAVLLTRKAGIDPTLPLLAAAQERQGERLGALTGEVKAALAVSEAAMGHAIQGFAVEQAKLLNEALLRQTASLATLEKSLLGEAKSTQEALGAGTLKQSETLATLEKSLLERFASDAQTTQQGLGAGLLKQAEALAAMDKGLLERLTADAKSTQEAMSAETTRSRDVLDKKLTEMRESSEKRLTEIQKSVSEQLAGAVEKQMNESFQRVIDQFAAIQQMMGNVQSVATQVGDLKRLFGNIKTRGGWGEAQLKAMLDDFIGPAAYETNVKLRDDSNDMVEFAIIMPGGDPRARLPLDAKFPSEDYERLMLAHEAGDLAGEAQARRAIETRIRGEAAKIRDKYICPPRSTEYAILFLPTEGLYAEVARIPGLIDDIARGCQVFIAGPSLLPAMLKTVQLGYVSFALSQNAQSVGELLAATKTEMGKMDQVLERLGKQVGTVSNTIGSARVRTKAIARKLRGLEALPGDAAEALLEIEATIDDLEDETP